MSGGITVRASVTDATKVEFYLDGVRQFTDSSTPYAWTWNTATAANGSRALTAKAYNGAALLGTSASVNVTVNITTPDTASFRQSQSQVASLITRAVSRGQRNL